MTTIEPQRVPVPASPPPRNPTVSHTLEDRLYHAKQILSDPELAATLTTLVNRGFKNANSYDPSRWDLSGERFDSPNDIHDMLGPDGFFAVICDGTTPVACAAAIPWKGDQDGLRKPGEDGFEIKTVTVEPERAKQGLASRAIGTLQEHLVAEEIKRRVEEGMQEHGTLKLWIHTAECVNGEYWRMRGYKDDRAYEKPIGYWSSRTGFRMLVLVKEVDLWNEGIPSK